MTAFTTFLWFDTQAEDAAEFYTSLFEDGRITRVRRYGATGDGDGGDDDAVVTVDFELGGQSFSAMNAGPGYPFNEAMSIEVRCDTQDDVDRYWAQLTEGGEERPCGWLKDRFGVFWQVMPQLLFDLQDGPDPVKSRAVFEAVLQMGKIESRGLQEAYDKA